MILFSPSERKENGKRKRKNTRWQGHGKEKDLVYQNGKQGLKTMQFYFERNDKCFCPKKSNLVLLEQKMFLHFSFILQKAIPLILFLSPFPPPQKKKKGKEEG